MSITATRSETYCRFFPLLISIIAYSIQLRPLKALAVIVIATIFPPQSVRSVEVVGFLN